MLAWHHVYKVSVPIITAWQGLGSVPTPSAAPRAAPLASRYPQQSPPPRWGGYRAPYCTAALQCLQRYAVLPLPRLCVDNNRYSAAAVPVADGSRARDGKSTFEFTNIVPAPARGGRYSAVQCGTVQYSWSPVALSWCSVQQLYCTVPYSYNVLYLGTRGPGARSKL